MKVIKYVPVLAVIAVTLLGCAALGTSPTEADKTRFQSSEQYNAETELFENRRPDVFSEMKERSFDLSLTYEFFFGDLKDGVPTQKLPEVKPDMNAFLEASDDLKVIWFGHSSFLINMDGIIILVDPVFSGAASPVSFAVQRFQAPVLNLQELPEIDYLLISHDHYDHLDMESVKFFKDKSGTFIVPLGVGAHLKGWGIEEQRIVEKDWWESASFTGVEFISAPAQHFSGRGLFDENKTLWASWIIRSSNHNLYFSGDSGYDIHFKEIGERYGPFDVAFIESGQYNERWREVHLLPPEAVWAYHDLKAKKFFPIHWGMFELAMHPWYDPVQQLHKLSKEKDVNLLTPKIGQIVNLGEDQIFERWWEKLMSALGLYDKSQRAYHS